MTNDEIRKNDEIRMAKSAASEPESLSTFGLRISFVIRHSSFNLLKPSSANQSSRPVAFQHVPDYPRRVAPRPDEPQNCVRFVRSHDHRHANAHVEDLIQLFFRHAAFGLDHSKNRRHVPGAFADGALAVLRQHTRYVIDKS